MKIAIVINDKRRTPKRQDRTDKKAGYLWAHVWREMCIANSIEFKEFDSFDPDFIENLLVYDPDMTLWRSIGNTLMKFKDEMQRQSLDKTGLRILPNWRTHYFYDHKIRQSYAFKLRGIPHPETKVFFNEPYALKYIKSAKYPFVVKADGGAGGKSFRLIETKEQAQELVNNIFHRKGKWTGREWERSVLYAQEYIPAPGVWRIWMFKDKVATGQFIHNAEGTLKASGHGRIEYLPTPVELLDMAMRINQGMCWDWCMYDIIWSKKHKQYLVLEITDTVSDRDWQERKAYYCREGEKWIEKKGNPPPPEFIFKLFVLKEMP